MVPRTGSLPEKLRQEILGTLSAYMKETGLAQAHVAKAVGTSATYVNNLMTGSGNLPDETRDQLLRDINNWLDREVRARENRRPDGYVETTVARSLIDLAQRLTERADIALAYGPAGIGKTITAQAIAAELGAVYVLVDNDCASPTGLRDKLFNAISRRKTGQRVRLADCIDKLRRPAKVAARSLVILDEAQDLAPKSFVMVRKLHEQAACSILLLGTVDLRERVSSDEDMQFGQLSSRVGVRLDLAPELTSSGHGGGKSPERLFTVEDIRALFNRGKLKLHPRTVRMLATIANSTIGTLRRVDRLVYQALNVASVRKAERVMPEDVEMAAQLVGEELGISAADVLAEAAPGPAGVETAAAAG